MALCRIPDAKTRFQIHQAISGMNIKEQFDRDGYILLREKDLYAREAHMLNSVKRAWIPNEVFNYFANFFK